MCMAVKESIWLSRLLYDFQELQNLNQWRYRDCKKISVKQRSKHIDLQYHFVPEVYKSNLISLRHVGSEEQRADSVTKPLGSQLFTKLSEKQGLYSKAHLNSIGSRESVENLNLSN